MRSSYKTTVKSLLKSGEVFAVSFLQSLFHFYGPLVKIQQVTQCQDWQGTKSCRGQGNREVTPASRLCQSGVHSLGLCFRFYRCMVWTILWWKTFWAPSKGASRWQMVFLSILLKGGCLPSNSCPPSLPGAEGVQRQDRLTHVENS